MYKSQRGFRNFWKEYRILDDRIELETVFSTIVIKPQDIEEVRFYKPPVFFSTLLALKLDMADLYPHVGIKRKNGLFRDIRFTPMMPERFIEELKTRFPVPTP